MTGLSVVNRFVEVPVFHAVRMLGLRLQDHQVDHIDDPDADIRDIVPQQRHGRQGLDRRHVAGAGHHHVRIAVLIAGPVPDARAGRAMANRRFHIEPLPFGLLAGHDHVDVVAAAQAVIRHRQQAIGVRRQIYPHDIGFLVGDMIDEAGILMGKAVMILAPDMGGQKIIERGDGLAPAD